jgi:hypothetical protein
MTGSSVAALLAFEQSVALASLPMAAVNFDATADRHAD